MKENKKTIISEIKDKTSWYDGKFYSVMYKYLGGNAFNEITEGLINPETSVIDIGCGPGMLIFHLLESGRCKRAVGVDISPRMIEYANKLKKHGHFSNVDFYHMNAINLSQKIDERFDYAIASYILHELPEDIKHKVLEEMKKVAREFIIDEYAVPQPKILGFFNWLMEIAAGVKHYNNYRNFIKKGGIEALLSLHGLKIKQKVTKWNAYEFIKAYLKNIYGKEKGSFF